MSQRNNWLLVLILLLAAAVIWVDLPNNPGIHIGSFNRSLETSLGLDLRGGLQVLLEADVPATTNIDAQSLQDVRQILENRANGLGVSEVTFQTAGSRRLVGEFPGLTNTDQVLAVLKQTGQLEFVDFGSNPLPEGTVIKTDLNANGETVSLTPTATVAPATSPTATGTANATPSAAAASTAAATPTATATPETIYHTVMTGNQLNQVGVTTGTVSGYEISFTLKDAGKKTFADYTTAHVNQYLGLVLDKKVISAPQVQVPITDGSGVIQGKFTYDSANALAIQLRYGSLPIPMKVIQSQTVTATLSQDSVRKSETAGIIGLCVIILFMILYYRLPGVVASLALALYAGLTFALFKLIPVTLTLPGIAGFVLTIGVAVDANILIFERLKEELRAGRTLQQAIDLGWQRAWPSIRDSNISTIITSIILFWYGTAFGASLVKGFSLTLFLGVVVSLFTAVVVTRTILHAVLDNLKFTEHPRWFGV
jgi:preprotein translocase subunit SecD